MSSNTMGAENLYNFPHLAWRRQLILRLPNTSFHPLLCFALQIVIISFTIGFVPPRSISRLLLLPLVLFCNYSIITGGSEYLRLFWVSPLSGFANGIALQYVDLGLLSHWGYETHSTAILDRNQSGDTLPQNQVSNLIDRFYFGFLSTFSFRKVNTLYEVRNNPQFQDGKPPSKSRFLVQHAIRAFLCILVVDLSAQVPPPPNSSEIFSAEQVGFLTRFSKVSGEEIAVRVFGSLLYWCNLFSILQGVFSLSALFTVGVGLSDVKVYKPLFGSLRDTTDLRRFWGEIWHQSLRDVLYKPASFISHKLLQLPPGVLARYSKLFLTFLISGYMHAFAEVATGLTLQQGGAVRFFCTQAVGIMVEDTVKEVLLDPILARCRISPLARRSLGYVWVGCFLAWSTPAWLYPDAVRGAKTPFLPFSIAKFVLQ